MTLRSYASFDPFASAGGDVRLRRGVWCSGSLDLRRVAAALGGGALVAVRGGDVVTLQVRDVVNSRACRGGDWVAAVYSETAVALLLNI